MLMNFDMVQDSQENVVSIKVIGVGGGGGNAVNRMVEAGMKGVEFVSVNTDTQALIKSSATYKLTLGEKLTKGQGCGGLPEKGQRAAEESRDEIAASLKNTDMVFITAGMGGGTGTGGAPVVAQVAHDMGVLTVGIVTKPFTFEGRRRMEQAEMGITALREHVDALLVIPNDRLKEISEEKITLKNAFVAADDVLRMGVQSISDLINVTGAVNLDFADVTAIMKDAGYAHMGVGYASGKDKARLAAEEAIASPLLETSIRGARGVIVNITAAPDIDLEDIETTSSLIHNAAHPEVNLIWGVSFDEALSDEIKVTVIATGFEDANSNFVTPFQAFSKAVETRKMSDPIPVSMQQQATVPDAQPIPVIKHSSEEDDNFFDILSIFNNKK